MLEYRGVRPGESFRTAKPRWRAYRDAVRAHYGDSGSYAETGRVFGISRQRVHQIIGYHETDTPETTPTFEEAA